MLLSCFQCHEHQTIRLPVKSLGTPSYLMLFFFFLTGTHLQYVHILMIFIIYIFFSNKKFFKECSYYILKPLISETVAAYF